MTTQVLKADQLPERQQTCRLVVTFDFKCPKDCLPAKQGAKTTLTKEIPVKARAKAPNKGTGAPADGGVLAALEIRTAVTEVRLREAKRG